MENKTKFSPGHFIKIVLLAVFVVTAAVYLVILSRNALKQYNYIGKSDQYPYTISISGTGKATAVPDLARLTIGIKTEGSAVFAAQQENASKMNKITEKIKAAGVAAEDMQTANYQINPRYDWIEGKRILRGYDVDQSLTVKIRNLEKIGDILTLASEDGANEVSGISFTIDDPEKLKQEAREKALANAKEKADTLAKIVGVKLGRIVSFTEDGYVPPFYGYEAKEIYGMGGGATPDVQAGSTDVTINATIVYEIL